MSDVVLAVRPSKFKKVHTDNGIVKAFTRDFVYQPMRGWDFELDNAEETLADLSHYDRDSDLAISCLKAHKRIETAWDKSKAYPDYVVNYSINKKYLVIGLNEGNHFWWDFDDLPICMIAKKIGKAWKVIVANIEITTRYIKAQQQLKRLNDNEYLYTKEEYDNLKVIEKDTYRQIAMMKRYADTLYKRESNARIATEKDFRSLLPSMNI